MFCGFTLIGLKPCPKQQVIELRQKKRRKLKKTVGAEEDKFLPF